MTYFDGDDEVPELYYNQIVRESRLRGSTNHNGKNIEQTKYPALLSIGDDVWLAWLEDGADRKTNVMHMTSVDAGKTWSNAKALLCVKGKVDYPKLLQYKGRAYLSVNTVDGLKVMAM